MLNKHLLKFQVNGGEDNREKMWARRYLSAWVDCVPVHMCPLGRYAIREGHYIYKYRMMVPRIQSVSPPRGITDQQCLKTTKRCSGGSTDSVVREKNSAFWLHHSLSESP